MLKILLPTLQEDLEEIEALVEVEQLQLLQHQQQQGNERPDINILRSPGEDGRRREVVVVTGIGRKMGK